MQVPAEIGRKLRPILTADPLKSKGGEQAPLALPALFTAEQGRAGRSMAAHERGRSSRPLTASAGVATFNDKDNF